MASSQDNGAVQNPNRGFLPEEEQLVPSGDRLPRLQGNGALENPNCDRSHDVQENGASTFANVRSTQSPGDFILGEPYVPLQQQLLGLQGNGAVRNPNSCFLPNEELLIQYRLRQLHGNGANENPNNGFLENRLRQAQGNDGFTVGNSIPVRGEPYVPLQQRLLGAQGNRFSPLIRDPEAFFLDAIPMNQRSQASSYGIADLERGLSRLDLLSSRTNSGLTNGFSNRHGLTNQRNIKWNRGDNLSLGLERLAQQGTYMRNGYESGESSSGSPYQRSRSFYGSESSRSYSPSLDQYSVSTNGFRGFEYSMNQETDLLSRNHVDGLVNINSGPRETNLRLSDLSGRITSCARKETYSRFWEHAMDEASREEIDMVFSEIAADTCDLSVHAGGSILVQNLIEKCSAGQRTRILLVMISDINRFFDICINQNGVEAVMKLWQFLSSDEEKTTFLAAVNSIFIELTRTPDGHHFITSLSKNVPFEYIQPLLVRMANASVNIAKDKHGCRILNQLILSFPCQTAGLLVRDIIANAVQLSEDCYGNYVVQHVLKLREPIFTENLLQELRGNFVTLSFSKYGSHVVEKCLEKTSAQQSQEIIAELITSPSVSQLLNDPFGNFVIQSALRTAKGYLYLRLEQVIQTNYEMMSYNKYGKKVIDSYKSMSRRR